MARIIDPAGGSWYVESLTDGIARAAWAWFAQIEAAGVSFYVETDLCVDASGNLVQIPLSAAQTAQITGMVERAGLEVVAETAILFIPGWLRMLDLACHVWCRPLAAITGALVWPFAFLDRHVPAVRRHGYLLATVAMKDSARVRERYGFANS